MSRPEQARPTFNLAEVMRDEGVILNDNGRGGLVGTCPFCLSEGQTLVVNPVKDWFKCVTGCKRNGDSVSFYAAIHDIERRAARRTLELRAETLSSPMIPADWKRGGR